MAIRKVVRYGEQTLRQPSKEVHKVSQKVKNLVQDLIDTMYASNGVGLAAPQIGENVRIFVLDVSTNEEPLNPIVFINPKIIKKSGACISHEGCLSFPEAFTDVRRYANVMVKALDSNGRSFVLEAKEGPLFDDLLIFLPSSSLTIPLISTLLKGMLPIVFFESMTILATQKNMISCAVTSVLVGKNLFKSSVCSGYPKVEKGQRAELNHVSNTSSSW